VLEELKLTKIYPQPTCNYISNPLPKPPSPSAIASGSGDETLE
jgi:hypothetical protein